MLNLARRLLAFAASRPPDFIVGHPEDPYLWRWHILPRNRFFNIYLHRFWRSDDDRALHDHPWADFSLILDGCYAEHAAGGFKLLKKGDWRLRLGGGFAHRIELVGGHCWTLFVTGPRYREWGFHCTDSLGYWKWVPWQEFTRPGNPGETGRGCG